MIYMGHYYKLLNWGGNMNWSITNQIRTQRKFKICIRLVDHGSNITKAIWSHARIVLVILVSDVLVYDIAGKV